MAVLLKIETKLVGDVDRLLDKINIDLATTTNQLDALHFQSKILALTQSLIQEKLNPAISKIKEIQKKIGTLRKFMAEKRLVDEISVLLSDILIDTDLAKHELEEMGPRSNALAVIQLIVSKKLVPAINKVGEVRKKVEILKRDLVDSF